MRAFGAQGAVSLIGYLYKGQTVTDRGEVVRGFARASAAAKDALANEPGLWDTVRPLMAAEDDATFATLKRDFLAGIRAAPSGPSGRMASASTPPWPVSPASSCSGGKGPAAESLSRCLGQR